MVMKSREGYAQLRSGITPCTSIALPGSPWQSDMGQFDEEEDAVIVMQPKGIC